jgi:hypothetical protein
MAADAAILGISDESVPRPMQLFRPYYISLRCRRKNSPFGLKQFALRALRFDECGARKSRNSGFETFQPQ